MNHTDNTYTFSIPPMPVTEPLRLEAGPKKTRKPAKIIFKTIHSQDGTKQIEWDGENVWFISHSDKVSGDHGWTLEKLEEMGSSFEKIVITEHIAPQSEEDSKTDFPAVGTRLRFLEDNFHCTGEKVGAEVRVLAVRSHRIETTKSNDSGEWWFDKSWRDGLEPLPTPPVRPEGTKEVPEGTIFIIGEDDNNENRVSYLYVADSSGERWGHYSEFRLDRGFNLIEGGFYADYIGSPAHRSMSWFHESQVVAGEAKPEPKDGWLPISEAPSKGKFLAPSFDGNVEEFEEIHDEDMRGKRWFRSKESGAVPIDELTVFKPIDSTTYPPDESEWPEKPKFEDVVWERQPMEGKADFESDYIFLESSEMKWLRHANGSTWHNTVVFRAVSAPQWRELGVGHSCPFCGNSKLMVIEPDRKTGFAAYCTNCEAQGPRMGLEMEAWEEWKHRTRRPLPPSDTVDPNKEVDRRIKEKATENLRNGLTAIGGERKSEKMDSPFVDPVSGVNVPGEKIIYRCSNWIETDRIERIGNSIRLIQKDGRDIGDVGCTTEYCEELVKKGKWTREVVAPPAERKAREVTVWFDKDGSVYNAKAGNDSEVLALMERVVFREVLDGKEGA